MKKLRKGLFGLVLCYEAFLSYGGYVTARDWNGCKPSMIGVFSNKPAVVRDLAELTANKNLSPLERVAGATLTAAFAAGAPGYELGRAAYHLL